MAKDTIASKVGRPPKFKTPLELAKVADAYFESCDNNPIEISTRKTAGSEQSAKNGSKVKALEYKESVPTPYTIEDFCDFANISNWTVFKQSDTAQQPEYLSIIHAIELRIRGQQIRGSLVGLYNANLTARINGIAETTKNETTVKAEVKTEDPYAELPVESQQRIARVILEERHKQHQLLHNGKANDTDNA